MAQVPSQLFLADHLLRDALGHHLGYNLALADAASRAGMSPCLITHHDFESGSANGVACRKIFHTDFRADPPPWIARNHRLLDLLEKWCDLQFARNLRSLTDVNASDAVFAQMLAPRHFLRWLGWLAAHPSPPVLFLHLGYRPERFAAPEIRRAFEAISPAVRRRVALITDSEKLVEPFETNLSSKVFYLPHILSYPVPQPLTARSEKPFVIFAPGNARREKGFAEMVGAVRKLRAVAPSGTFRFVIQCNNPDAASAAIIGEGLDDSDDVEWIARPLGDEEYVQRLLASDVIVLPYHLDLYSSRTSGVFCEARVAGKPVIASRGSWAGDRVAREGGGWLVEERNVEDLAKVVLSLPDEIEKKRIEAVTISPAARAEFHRDNFMDGLQNIYSLATREAS
jgi:glycosyltransferase involved in cell wall biosynthesis